MLWVLEDNSAARAFYEATGWKFDKRDPSYRDLQRRLYPLSPSLVAEHLPSHEVARAAFEPVLDAHQLVAERPGSSSYLKLTKMLDT